jgi:hypothetical protein
MDDRTVGIAPNVANRKGFWLVLQCQNVAKSAAMQTTVESQPSPSGSTPDASVNAGDAGVTTAPSSSAATRRQAASEGPAAHGPREEDAVPVAEPRPREIGGRDGPEPTRFGDWEKAGRCIDF